MISKPDDLPSDLVSALAALQAEREARLQAEAVAASARAELSDNEALIAHLELRIEKLKRELYGQRSERTARLLEQLELELEELVTTASEDELAAQAAAAKTQNVRPFMRKRPVHKPWPDDIERERVVIEAPTTCACCGGSRLAKIGEDVTKTLDEIPRRFKLIETVREKFTCRDCEKISQPPAPCHATPAGGGAFRLERPARGASPAASGCLRPYPASRLLQRLRAAGRPAEEGAADYGGVLLCPCAAGLLRAG